MIGFLVSRTTEYLSVYEQNKGNFVSYLKFMVKFGTFQFDIRNKSVYTFTLAFWRQVCDEQNLNFETLNLETWTIKFE